MKKAKKIAPPLRLDLGCGNFPQEGFVGVDILKLPGVQVVTDLRKRWPWKSESVDEAISSHFIEHLEGRERIHFFNELWRILKKGARATIHTPHWASTRAYGDVDHKWPPVCEQFYKSLDPEFRRMHQPHLVSAFRCDFAETHGYQLHDTLAARSDEHRNFAISFYKEACQDLIATITKR